MINIVKWVLIALNVLVNNTLMWKILRRKSLHTIFNLGMCFFFFWSGFITPCMINDYGNLLQEMMVDPDTTHPDICLRIFQCRILLHQAMKIIFISIIFR